MTDDQIKQNAEEYSNGIDGSMCYPAINDAAYNAYIAGAHSRDEEITRLSAEIEDDNYVTSKLRKELNQLRNPWISVEDRLPEESGKYKGWLSDTVFVVTSQCDGTSARYDHATKTWCPAKILQGSITHWMPIPQIEKGE